MEIHVVIDAEELMLGKSGLTLWITEGILLGNWGPYITVQQLYKESIEFQRFENVKIGLWFMLQILWILTNQR